MGFGSFLHLLLLLLLLLLLSFLLLLLLLLLLLQETVHGDSSAGAVSRFLEGKGKCGPKNRRHCFYI